MYKELEIGYTREEAVAEAKRCLNCKNPQCVEGCPVRNRIPEFIAKVKEEDFFGAYEIVTDRTNMPQITGRVCYRSEQCEGGCILSKNNNAINIGKLERFVADYVKSHKKDSEAIVEKNNENVAIIGSGPSGISAALDLAKAGFDVTIYEKEEKIGGVLTYGIPGYRLPKETVGNLEEELKSLDVKIELGVTIGESITFNELKNKFNYIYIASGANVPRRAMIENEEEVLAEVQKSDETKNKFVYSTEFLKSVNNEENLNLGNDVYVIGGGDVAMDTARCVVRSGSNITVLYRRTEEKMGARLDEKNSAIKEGVKFSYLVGVKRVSLTHDGRVSLKCVKNRLVKDENNFDVLEEVPGTEYAIEADNVIVAVGFKPNHEEFSKDSADIAISKSGTIITNESYEVNDNKRIYAGGDVVTGSLTVVYAIKAGRKAAKSIIEKSKK